MVTLRMLAIASAILVSLPIGFALANTTVDHVVVQGGEIVRANAEAAAEITDIVLVDTFAKYDQIAIANTPEQLVEGHTVFTVIDIQFVKNESTWTADIAGGVDCDVHHEVSGPTVYGVPVPNRIHRAQLECVVNGTVYVTPDPFYDSDDTVQQSSMQPTGVQIPFTAPTGETGFATEYVYELVSTDWLGETTTQALYAWSVPLLEEPWLHSDGGMKSWYCPLPVARLQEMGITTFTARLESDRA